MRRCRVAISNRKLCFEDCSVDLPNTAAPMCEAHRRMLYAMSSSGAFGACEFFHFAHAGLLRAREAVS